MNNQRKNKFCRKAERCDFLIFSAFLWHAEASAHNMCPVLLVGLFLVQKKGFHVAGFPGVPGAMILGALVPSQV